MTAGVAMIDLDDFKVYNDTCGHDAGDMVLVTVVDAIRRCIRKSDVLVRYGGDEFLLVMPGIQEDDFAHKLRKIKRNIHAATVPGYSNIRLSASAAFSLMAIALMKLSARLISYVSGKDKERYSCHRWSRKCCR